MLLSPSGGGDPGVALNAASGDAVWDCFIRGKKITAGDVIICPSAENGVPLGGMTCTVVRKSGQDATVRLAWGAKGEGGGGMTLGEVCRSYSPCDLPQILNP